MSRRRHQYRSVQHKVCFSPKAQAAPNAIEYLDLIENVGRHNDTLVNDARLHELKRFPDVCLGAAEGQWWQHMTDPQRRGRLAQQLLTTDATRIAVVCHYALINFIYKEDVKNFHTLEFDGLPFRDLQNCDWVHSVLTNAES